MTQVEPTPITTHPYPARVSPKGSVLLHLLRTTDPKDIAILYLVTTFAFFMVGGLMAMLMRAELAAPGQQFLSNEQYNQLFTMHGTIMLLLYATPTLFGFANYIVPLQIGAPDVAFPRLNAFSYWLFLFGGLVVLAGFLTPGGAADFGWFAYTPLSDAIHSPGAGGDLWIMGLVVSGLGTILGAVNFITTIVCLRAPGMTMFRMPMFCWTIFVTAFLILLAFPVLTAALLGLLMDRQLGAHVFDPANGGAILWQHLFWFFGHPEVYIVALPFFGIISEVIPVFSRKPLFGYKGMIYAAIAIAALSAAVWAHHMYATGAVLLAFFSLTSFMIAIPTGIKFVNWIGTMWKGQITFETPMMFAIGFLITFLFGGMTGVLLASPPIDFHVTDTYFVVAHFHYVLFGTIVFATYAGIYFWFPKMTGRMMNETLGKIHFWLTFIGFHTTFLVMHWLGNEGMPRRYADYLPTDGFTTLNVISSIGAFVLGASDPAVHLERVPLLPLRPRGDRGRPVGLRQLAGVGHLAARRRGTTSPRSPASAPNAPPSTCTTPTWSSGLGTRPTPGTERIRSRGPPRSTATRAIQVPTHGRVKTRSRCLGHRASPISRCRMSGRLRSGAWRVRARQQPGATVTTSRPERGRAFSGPPGIPFFVVIRMTPTSPSSAAANTRLPPTRRHRRNRRGPRRRVVRRGSIGTIFGTVPAVFARLIVIGTTLVILSTLLHSLTAADIGLILFLLAAIGACAGAGATIVRKPPRIGDPPGSSGNRWTAHDWMSGMEGGMWLLPRARARGLPPTGRSVPHREHWCSGAVRPPQLKRPAWPLRAFDGLPTTRSRPRHQPRAAPPLSRTRSARPAGPGCPAPAPPPPGRADGQQPITQPVDRPGRSAATSRRCTTSICSSTISSTSACTAVRFRRTRAWSATMKTSSASVLPAPR